MNERIKEIRKSLNMTQQEFSEKIGVTRGAICKIEIGDRNVTEQMIKSICREFLINEEWLRTGIGPKNIQITPEEKAYMEFAEIMESSNEPKKAFIKMITSLVNNTSESVWDYIYSEFQSSLEHSKPTKK